MHLCQNRNESFVDIRDRHLLKLARVWLHQSRTDNARDNMRYRNRAGILATSRGGKKMEK